jgi:hypothetical protein
VLVENPNYHHRLAEVKKQLADLMQEQIESLRAQVFVGLTQEELLREDDRLHRIRELSAELLALLKK